MERAEVEPVVIQGLSQTQIDALVQVDTEDDLIDLVINGQETAAGLFASVNLAWRGMVAVFGYYLFDADDLDGSRGRTGYFAYYRRSPRHQWTAFGSGLKARFQEGHPGVEVMAATAQLLELVAAEVEERYTASSLSDQEFDRVIHSFYAQADSLRGTEPPYDVEAGWARLQAILQQRGVARPSGDEPSPAGD